MAEMTPLDWLAIAMSVRAKEAAERVPKQEEYEKGLVGQRVTKFGGDMGAFEDVWQRGYGPQAASAQATNRQMQDYWTNLAEPLVKAAKEGTKTGTGTGSQVPVSPTFDPSKILAALLPTQQPTVGGMGVPAFQTPTETRGGVAPRMRTTSSPRAQRVSSPSRSRVVNF